MRLFAKLNGQWDDRIPGKSRQVLSSRRGQGQKAQVSTGEPDSWSAPSSKTSICVWVCRAALGVCVYSPLGHSEKPTFQRCQSSFMDFSLGTPCPCPRLLLFSSCIWSLDGLNECCHWKAERFSIWYSILYFKPELLQWALDLDMQASTLMLESDHGLHLSQNLCVACNHHLVITSSFRFQLKWCF